MIARIVGMWGLGTISFVTRFMLADPADVDTAIATDDMRVVNRALLILVVHVAATMLFLIGAVDILFAIL